MGDVQDVGVGDISSWRSLAHQQHNLSLCKKSVCVCFHRNNITLYKISRHFFFCFMFKWSQVAYYPLHTLHHLLLTSFISSASIWTSLWCELTVSCPLKVETAWCRRAGPSWRRWGCGQEPWTDCWGSGCRRAAWMSGSRGTGRG